MKRVLPSENVTRLVHTLKNAKSDSKFGSVPSQRSPVDLLSYGIIVVNKPKGPSSHQVADSVKKILGIPRAGHSGTLDPGVTGVLPIALGRATRITQALLPAGKEYIALMQLHDDVAPDVVRRHVEAFLGKITQKPPVRSAVKRVNRIREIYYADIIAMRGRFVLIRMGCQGGTYVRKWMHDVGAAMGCQAHMAQLVRTKAGPFAYEEMWTLQDIEDALWYHTHENNDVFLRKVIRPVEDAVTLLPKIWVLDSAINTLTHGQDVMLPGVARIHSDIAEDDLVAVMSLKDELVCLARACMSSKTALSRKRGRVCETKKVFMQPGIYPSIRRD